MRMMWLFSTHARFSQPMRRNVLHRSRIPHRSPGPSASKAREPPDAGKSHSRIAFPCANASVPNSCEKHSPVRTVVFPHPLYHDTPEYRPVRQLSPDLHAYRFVGSVGGLIVRQNLQHNSTASSLVQVAECVVKCPLVYAPPAECRNGQTRADDRRALGFSVDFFLPPRLGRGVEVDIRGICIF